MQRVSGETDEGRRVGNVLEGHFTGHEVGLMLLVLVGVKILDHLGIGYAVQYPPIVIVAGVKPETLVATEAAQQLEEFALAAANFQHRLVLKLVAFDEIFGQLLVVFVKGAGKSLGFFVPTRILGEFLYEGHVADKTALITKSKDDIAAGVVSGLFLILH